MKYSYADIMEMLPFEVDIRIGYYKRYREEEEEQMQEELNQMKMNSKL